MDHQNILKELCRICGQRAISKKERKNRTAKRVHNYTIEVKTFYGLCTESDIPNLHPDKLCSICYRRLINSKVDGRSENRTNSIYQEDALKTNTLWKCHTQNECHVCMLYQCQKNMPSKLTFLGYLKKTGKLGNPFYPLIMNHVALQSREVMCFVVSMYLFVSTKLKANQPHPRGYLHMFTDTDKHIRLVMGL